MDYARLAEKKYLERYGAEDVVPPMYVMVDAKDEYCMFLMDNKVSLTFTQYLFYCKMVEGKAFTTFVSSGKDRVVDALNLHDLYANIKRVVCEKKLEGNVFRIVVPEEYRSAMGDFCKVKLLGLDDFVFDFDYVGWGNHDTLNVFEVVAGISSMIKEDAGKHELLESYSCTVCESEDYELEYVHAEFCFSHLEVAELGKGIYQIYLCYKYDSYYES